MITKPSFTRELIFDSAVRLISELDYDSINMRTIASRAGIRASSIYNHFKSKEAILDSIYDYYTKHFYDNKRSDEEIMDVIANGTQKEIIDAFNFTFECSDKDHYARMILITKIIYLRHFKDKRANDIFFGLMTLDNEKRVESLLNYGMSIGKLKPIDARAFSVILVSARHFMGIKAFSRKDYSIAQLEEEKMINSFFENLLL